MVGPNPSNFRQTNLTDRFSDIDYDGQVRSTVHTMLLRQEPNRGHQRHIRILADPFEFHQNQCSDRVSDVDYGGEVRCTLHTIIWRRESNRGRRRQIRISVDPFEFNQTQCSDIVLDVDYDVEVFWTQHTKLWCPGAQQSSPATDCDFGGPLSNFIKLSVLIEFQT